MGERIVAARGALGITQQQLAAKLGKTYQQVSAWERGDSALRAKNLHAIAEALEITPQWLRTGEGPMVASPLKGLTSGDFSRIADKTEPYSVQPPGLNLALLEQVIREVLTQAPGESSERLAQIASEVYGIAQRTRRLDRVTELVRMLLS